MMKNYNTIEKLMAKSSVLYAAHIHNEKSIFFNRYAHNFDIFGIDPKLAIDVALTEEEILEQKQLIEKSFTKLHDVWKKKLKVEKMRFGNF